MKAITGFLTDVRVELRKVSWPKREEVIKMTVIVIIATISIGVYVGIIDFVLTKFIATVV